MSCEAVEETEDKFLILSLRSGPADGHALWYRPNARGYTTKYSEAGRYTKDEADTHTNGEDVVSFLALDVLAVSEFGHISWASAQRLALK